MKKLGNLKSEAAIKFVIKNWEKIFAVTDYFDPVINFYQRKKTGSILIARIDLREFVKKRQPLTGIKKQLSKIVQGKRKKR